MHPAVWPLRAFARDLLLSIGLGLALAAGVLAALLALSGCGAEVVGPVEACDRLAAAHCACDGRSPTCVTDWQCGAAWDVRPTWEACEAQLARCVPEGRETGPCAGVVTWELDAAP